MRCCRIRVSGQAIANTLCFGATAAILTYTLVRVAANAHSKVVAAAVTTFFFFWFCAGCTAYLASCRTDDDPEPPPPRGGGRRRVAPDDDDVITYYEQPEGAPSLGCPVCKEEVRPGQMVGRPTPCLHAFHRHCIDSWLKHHSTCPVCRGNVHAPLLAHMV